MILTHGYIFKKKISTDVGQVNPSITLKPNTYNILLLGWL